MRILVRLGDPHAPECHSPGRVGEKHFVERDIFGSAGGHSARGKDEQEMLAAGDGLQQTVHVAVHDRGHMAVELRPE